MSVPGILILSAIVATVLVMFQRHDSLDENGFEVFLIKVGKFFSLRINRPFPIPFKIQLAPKTLRFTAIFGNGCDYKLDSDSVNKLYGISYGVDPHWRSVRIGWRYNSNLRVIELFLYTYIRGERTIKKLFNVKQHEEVHFTIFKNIHDNTAVVEGRAENGHYVVESVKGVDRSACRFILFPYFGGKQPAPNNMKIYIKS